MAVLDGIEGVCWKYSFELILKTAPILTEFDAVIW